MEVLRMSQLNINAEKEIGWVLHFFFLLHRDEIDSGIGNSRQAEKENRISREVTTRTLRSRGPADIVTQVSPE